MALFALTGLTASQLHITRNPDKADGGFQTGHGCTITSTTYSVPATARMLWHHADTIHETPVHFHVYSNAHPRPGKHFQNPRCGA